MFIVEFLYLVHLLIMSYAFVYSFSSLFSGNDRGVAQHRKAMPNANFRYNAPTHHISPALDTMKKRSLHERKRGLDLLDSGDM